MTVDNREIKDRAVFCEILISAWLDMKQKKQQINQTQLNKQNTTCGTPEVVWGNRGKCGDLGG